MADDDCQIIFAKCKLWPTKVKKDEDEWMIEDMARVNLLDTTISVRSLDVGPKKQEDADSMILEDGELASAADRSLPPSDDEIIVVKKTTKDVRTRDRHRQSASERKIAHTASRTISKQSRKERDHQKPVLLQLAIRVKNQLFSSGTSFLAVQKLVETIFAKRRDSTRDLERLMRLTNDRFMRRIHSYLIDFNWKRLDPTLVEEVLGAMTRRAKLVKNNKSLVKPMLEAESSILPFSFIQFSGPSQILRLDRIKIIADGEVMDPLAAAWDGREFLFAGKDKLFSCDEKGDGLKLLYCTNSQPTALAVVCPGEVVAFVQGSTIKFYYKLEKKVETHITELRGPRGLAYIRGALITLEYIDGCYWIRAYSAYTKQMIGRQRYGYGKPSFVTSSAGRLYITDLRNKTVQIVAVSVSSNNSQAVFKTIMTTKLGKEELKEDNTIFPAGIAADSRGEIIVSDARHGAENCVLWFNAQMSQWSRVEIAPGAYPYGSQIAISPNGYFLVACRQSHGMALFKFVR